MFPTDVSSAQELRDYWDAGIVKVMTLRMKALGEVDDAGREKAISLVREKLETQDGRPPANQLESSWPIAYPRTMATNVERLAEQAMKLSGESRARLADLLVESLDAEDLGRIDRLWLAEAKRRRDEVREGRVKTVSGDEARRRIRSALTR